MIYIKFSTVRNNMMHLKKPAFTMLELVFVIVVLGILAAMAIPRMDRDLRQGAKDNILSALRFTQNLALVDNKTDPTNANWQRKFWTIRFSTASDNLATFYTVSSDSDASGTTILKNETAVDPANGRFMYNANADTTIGEDESPSIFIGKKYGINTMDFSGGCSNTQKHVAFDHLGRPYNGIATASNDYSQYMSSDCNIAITFIDTSITPLNITIATETGFATGD